MSRPAIPEKSKGLFGNPAAGPEAAVGPAGESLDDVSSLEVLFSAVPALSSKKISTCVKLVHFQGFTKNYSSYAKFLALKVEEM